MCLCCWVRLRNFIADYLTHCHNYTLLNWLSDMFKLFIILNYVYFAYMIFAKLWVVLNSYFEEKCKPQKLPCSRGSSSTQSQTNCRRTSQPCGQGEAPPRACTCHKPPASQCLPPQESESRCSIAVPLELVRDSVCTLFSKPNTPCEKNRSTEKKRSSDKRGLDCASSFERIQVEFNCKTKKPRKTRDGNKIPKSRSCTKCGKNMALNSSRCGTSRSQFGSLSRKLNCPK
uniref:Uncharacterized protein n=1 Tax=Cacopsylla melanoneura TaxID=428564 RepID=A0A8D8YMD4_9HEMI